ncbi:hypothetical protein BBO_07483 [Beauveria brongniartii RCEF 3172]|uniref:Uncharacterized protein n=1 Tax=Beauveria brongniartii RCEF 3172 TaxID=1081107 RepID=A0A166ZCB6_9HYPO|nr:hypothetical protein BBO_07483 [Beauveria brongniartii RCEF 3172]
MHSSSIILLALSVSSALAGQWGVYLYTDRLCEKQTAQWRDDQPLGCTNLDGYPDILAIKTDTQLQMWLGHSDIRSAQLWWYI